MIQGDTKNEADETFSVNLSNSSGAAVTVPTATGTILNDDPVPTLSFSSSSVTKFEGNSGLTPFIFTMSLSPVSGQTVTVQYATADGTAVAGTDYTSTTGTLSFAAGTTSKTVSVVVLGGSAIGPSKTFSCPMSRKAASSSSVRRLRTPSSRSIRRS